MTGSSAEQDASGKNHIIVQAGILAAASIIVRIIGLLYQAPLTAIIGDEGNGYYSYAYNIYTIVLLISSYSIPSAISKIMSRKLALGEYRNTNRIFHISILYVCIVGGVAGLLLYLFAGVLVGSGSAPVLQLFAPTIFFFGILGVLRGYFQAHYTMVQTSVSQIIEQIVNAGMSLLMAYLLIRSVSGKDATTQAIYGAAGSAIGTGCGVLAALVFMIVMYSMKREYIRKKVSEDTSGIQDSDSAILLEVIRVVTPFILSSFILNLTTSLNQTVYSDVLEKVRGISQAEVTIHYGIFSRKATVITNIPISIATAASAAVIPDISSAFALGDKKDTLRRVRNAVRMTALVAMPSAVALAVLARPVTMLLYPQMNSLPEASSLLSALAVTVFFYSISTVSNAILQSIDHMNLPIVSAVLALIVQTAALVFMLEKTGLGIYSLVIASVLYSVLIFISNEIFLHRYLGTRANLGKQYLPVFAASAVMGIAGWLVYAVLHALLTGPVGMGSGGSLRGLYFANLLAFLPAFFVALYAYSRTLILIGAVTERELLAMPKGEKIVRVLRKLHWFKTQERR
ncbi:MAG: polysaccharide biosynthesis protein [Lachnospiraceae bacterium]|jgi:stage V sporulation protein B|nr:polysaccharide biosynthesis protein [Lachnospiraceae bacterium]